LDVIGTDALAVDLDDRNQLAVASLELRVAVDRHLLGIEPELLTESSERRPRPLAEMAAVSLVENYSGYGYSPRVIVASATRRTARP
jgi:hypothetical protein